jgi:putative membrane protein
MHAGRHYSLREVGYWTRREALLFLIISGVPTVLHAALGWKWLAFPWLPIALVGTAVAFITGFKNNASYSRLWEARQIWGSIVNISRSWGVMVLDFLAPSPTASEETSAYLRAAQQRLIYRHIAWLTALRYQLREQRDWENMKLRHNIEYKERYNVSEWEGSLDEELARLMEPDEVQYVLTKKNRATQIIALQSRELSRLAQNGFLSDFQHVEMERAIAGFYDAQGRCERIKNFPYPRQFATLNLIFTWLFIVLVPLGLLQEFQKLGENIVWFTIPAGVTVSWVFHTMDKIGESSENPFEGSANDIPITALCRTIEIDLREMRDEAEIPPPVRPVNYILM